MTTKKINGDDSTTVIVRTGNRTGSKAGRGAGSKAGTRPGADAGATPDNNVDDLLSSLETQEVALVSISRITDEGKEEHCFVCGPKDYSWPQLFEKVRFEYGPGRYWARGKVGSHWKGGKLFSIAQSRNALPVAGPSAAAPGKDPTEALFKALAEMQQQSQKQMNDLLMKLIPAPGSGGSSFSEVLSAAKIMAGDKKDTLGEMVSMLEVGKKLGLIPERDRQGGRGSNDNDVLIEMIRELGAPVLERMSAERATRPARRAITKQPDVGPGGTPPGEQPAKPGTPAPAAAPTRKSVLHALLREQLKRLVKAAELDSDPAAYAVFITDQAPEQVVRQLLEPDAFMATLSAIDPRAAEHAEWFGELRNLVLEIYSGDEADEGDGDEAEPAAASAAPVVVPPAEPSTDTH